MVLSNCPECGKLFLAISPKEVCLSCLKIIDTERVKVEDFLWTKGRASVAEVLRETGVTYDTIAKMVKAGRVKQIFGTGWECEKCGVKISSGTYCPKCRGEQQKQQRAKQQRFGSYRTPVTASFAKTPPAASASTGTNDMLTSLIIGVISKSKSGISLETIARNTGLPENTVSTILENMHSHLNGYTITRRCRMCNSVINLSSGTFCAACAKHVKRTAQKKINKNFA